MPNLMSSTINRTIPSPPHGSIADLLSLPGTASMIAGGKATVLKSGNELILCLAAGASVQEQAAAVGLYHRGRVQDLVALGFDEDPSRPSCRYRKEVQDDGQPWQFLSEKKAAAPTQNSTDSSAVSDSSTVYVLSIGVSAYPGAPYPALPNPANDAKDFSAAITAAPSAHVTRVQELGPLIDQDATKEGIRTALAQLSASAKSDDTVVIFLSGHGTVPVGQEMFYFIPYYTQPSQYETSFDEQQSGINIAMLADSIRESEAKHVLIIVDACESGGLIDSLAKIAEVKEMALSSKTQPNKLGDDGGVVILAAAIPVEEAVDGGPLGHGLLVSSVLSFLQSSSPKTAESLRRYVDSTLPKLAAQYKTTQTPLTYSLGRDFYFK